MSDPGLESPPNPNSKRYGKMRTNMEAFGMAILMAVLLKYFAIEAYVIPTPSMQPTMMGSAEAGLRDRILVDKIRYEIFEPKRWDVAVFRYPLRQIQSYVKRIVGVGPEQLKIVCGNLYTRKGPNDSWEIARKPDRIQEGLWKEIYPLRYEMDAGTDRDVLRDYFSWSFTKPDAREPDVLIADIKANGKAELMFRDVRHQGFANHIFDGYGVGVARILRDDPNRSPESGMWGVQDGRMSYNIQPGQTPRKVILELEVTPSRLAFRMVVANGKARLQVVRPQKGRIPEELLVTSEDFPCELPAGESTPIAFAHVDDELIAWRDGDIIQRLACEKHRIETDLQPADVKARLVVEGGGKVTLSGVKIERDLHYTRSGDDIKPGQIIEIPADHFFMMGDNTLSSADSRAWKSIKIGVDEDSNIVDPRKHPSAKMIRGNKRPKRLSALPLSDDNPFPCMKGGRDWVAFGDYLGQMYRLKAKVPQYWGVGTEGGIDNSAEFISNKGGAFVPEEQHEPFVPREHIQGRPLLTFFRSFDNFFFDRWIR
jgi:signal peptidase I